MLNYDIISQGCKDLIVEAHDRHLTSSLTTDARLLGLQGLQDRNPDGGKKMRKLRVLPAL